MRVALFTETYLPYINGVVTHVKILKEGLERLGHEVLVVTADPHTKQHFIQDHVLHCPAREMKRFYGFGVANPISRKRLKILEEFNPDIIHIHNEFGIGLFGLRAAKALKKPVVYTLHTMYDEYIYYVAPKPLVKATRGLSHLYMRYLVRHANALTGPSKKCQEYFDQIGIQRSVSVIPNPVELDIFSPEQIDPQQKQAFRQRYGIDKEDMIACFVGRLGREKSVDVLLDYWAKSITPDDHIHLVIIGDGPDKPALEQQAKDLGIANMVTFTGKVMHDQLPPYYAECDVYITASLSDTNSISMLEGMATGLPVLQRLDPLNADQVVEGINGYLFNSPQEMGQKLREIKSKTPEELQILKRSVIESVKNSGAENLANYLLTIYHKLYEDKSYSGQKKTRARVHRISRTK